MNPLNINNLVDSARDGDSSARDNLIDSNRGFIRRISSYICKRSLDWSNDDELSIALLAFNEAIDSYNPEKGAEFMTYSRMLINSRLIDYFRKNANLPISLGAIGDEELSAIENKEAIDRYSLSYASEERMLEVKMFNIELSNYSLSMADLTYNCPKHKDTRKQLFNTAVSCSKNQEIIRSLKKNRMLPIKNILEISDLKRKFLEQWRKYLIALLIIVSSDEYIYLKEYINLGKEEVV